ncbi:MAG TPA: MarC family protein [Candidatus Acidoferrum sp.]|nr:MarC family protein [Candidatus Acidoferrum sp.]
MLEGAKSTLLILSALFPIVNPLGGSPIFLTLTRGYTEQARRALSWRIAINSFLLLVCSCLIGTHILSFFGISLPVVQVGGGLVVISTGWAMLKSNDEEDDSSETTVRKKVAPRDEFKNAFYPLTLPLTVGPGSISVAITLGANLPHLHGVNIFGLLAVLIGSLIIALTVYLCYGFSDRLARALGPTAMTVIMRLSSFLLVCIGVQILWNGVKALLVTLPSYGH